MRRCKYRLAVFHWGESYAGYLLSAGIVYLMGMIGVTAVYHLQRNLALPTFDP